MVKLNDFIPNIASYGINLENSCSSIYKEIIRDHAGADPEMLVICSRHAVR